MNQGKQTFLELLIGIGVTGVIGLFLAIVWAGSKGAYLSGLGLGLCLSAYLIYDMYSSIDRALDMDKKSAMAYTKKKTIVRLIAMIVILLVAAFVSQISIAGVIIGGLGLKFSAYLQPLTHKLFEKINKRKVRE